MPLPVNETTPSQPLQGIANVRPASVMDAAKAAAMAHYTALKGDHCVFATRTALEHARLGLDAAPAIASKEKFLTEVGALIVLSVASQSTIPLLAAHKTNQRTENGREPQGYAKHNRRRSWS